MRTIIENIGTLVTMEPLAREQRVHSVNDEDLGILKNAWLLHEQGQVHSFGPMPPPPSALQQADLSIDLEGRLMLPGLVDSHTHTLFAGSRHHEFAQRLRGATYQEIAAAGGGIRSTMQATRSASDDDLIRSCQQRIEHFRRWGVTTVEIKTGYGLSVEEELRLARILKKVQTQTTSHIVATCLALHDRSPEFEDLASYIADVEKRLLPKLVEENLCSFVDTFIDKGYYAPEQLESFMSTAKKLGFGIRVHADEFALAGGTIAAARWKASSADHLQCAGAEGAKALAESATIATLLPGTSLYTGIPFTDARPFLKAGCAVAVATDYNPGSSCLMNLAQLASVAAVHCHLTPAQALAAITYVPACSLHLGTKKGALAPGFDADFAVYDMNSIEEWLANMGQTAPKGVWLQGQQN